MYHLLVILSHSPQIFQIPLYFTPVCNREESQERVRLFRCDYITGRGGGLLSISLCSWASSLCILCFPTCFFPYPSLATPDTLGKHVGVDGTYFYKEGPLCHLGPRAKAKARLKKILLGCLHTSLSSLLIHSHFSSSWTHLPSPLPYESYSYCSLTIQSIL